MATLPDRIAGIWPPSEWTIAPGAAPDMDCCGNHPADSPEIQWQDEGGFSWQPCDSCGNTLGGNRYPAHAIHRDAFDCGAKRPDLVYHIDICADCLLWHANGDLPDA